MDDSQALPGVLGLLLTGSHGLGFNMREIERNIDEARYAVFNAIDVDNSQILEKEELGAIVSVGILFNQKS